VLAGEGFDAASQKFMRHGKKRKSKVCQIVFEFVFANKTKS